MAKNHLIKFDADVKHRFLSLYRLCGQLQRAALETGVAPSTVRGHLKSDPEFKDAYQEAYRDFQEQIEREVLRRGIMGWEEPVYQQGLLVGTIRKFDPRMLELAVKRHIPEYKESFNVDHNVSGGILVIPQIESKEDWEKRHDADPKKIDVEVETIDTSTEEQKDDD